MQEFQVFDWAEIGARIREKRVFLCWFIPVTFVVVWVLSFSVPTYFSSTTSLSTEQMRAEDEYRTLTLNRPEQFDLGLAPLAYSITPDDYTELLESTEFICRVLGATVMTADSSFTGTYYAYLATQYKYSWLKTVKRAIRGKKQPEAGEELPPLDPFYPRGIVAEAIGLAQNSLSCDVDRHSKLTTITAKAQDPLVAAMVAQAVADQMKLFTSEYYLSKAEETYEHLQEQIAFLHAEYQEAVRQGDEGYAAMLDQAYSSFQRQAIMFNAQLRYCRSFTTLVNASVPTEKAGPHHLAFALLATILIGLIALCIICRREIFGNK